MDIGQFCVRIEMTPLNKCAGANSDWCREQARRYASPLGGRRQFGRVVHTSVRIQSDTRGRLHWDAQWMHTDKALKGGWFIIRVGMDKTTALIPGK